MGDYIKEFLDDHGNQTFKVFEIRYTSKQKKCLDDFNITVQDKYEHFGSLDLPKLRDFLETVGENSKDCIIILEKLIKRLVAIVCEGYNRTSVWVSLRVTLPNKEFDIPRWHVDGNFYNLQKIREAQIAKIENLDPIEIEMQSKFITTLKGPGTLFCQASQQMRNEFFDIKDKFPLVQEEYQKNKLKRYEVIKSCKIKQLMNNQGAIFLVGHDYAAIHSEPKLDEPRIFLSILPGHPTEIQELKTRWKR